MTHPSNNNGGQIFLLSSTQDPYFRDIFDIMFYPSSVHYRFRYHKGWISDEFKDKDGQLDNGKVALISKKDALIVLILTEKKQSRVYDLLEFLPIRRAKIKNAKIVGDFLWVDFELSDWIVYQKNASPLESNEHHEAIKKLMPSDSKTSVKQLILKTARFDANVITDNAGLDGADTINNWTIITSHISQFSRKRHEPSKHPVFLKLAMFEDTTKEQKLKVSAVGKQTGFEIASEHSYAIDLVEYTDQGVDPFELELKTNETMISPIVMKSEIRGRYDLLHFNFVCNELTKNVVTMLAFESSSDNYLIARTAFWAKIKTKRFSYLIGPLLVFALSFLFLSEEFVKYLSGQPANLGTIVVGVLGSVLSTIAGIYLKK